MPAGSDDRDGWAVEPAPGPPEQVAVDVGGTAITVGCATHPLDDVAEAWGTALCLPAARVGATLRLPGAVDPTWAAGVAANVATAAGWWGGAGTLRIEAAEAPPAPVAALAPGRALCFTAGADSFFSLLAGDHRPSHLLFVVGFDVEVDDQGRADAVVAAVTDVGETIGVEPLVVRTDLRHHPGFSSVSWEHTHGAALAAIGHLLHPQIGTLVIPPSYALSRLVPWGSRPDLDPRWSVPGRLHVEHGDATGRRVDRVLAVASHPLVHRHLRVCWQNVGDAINCGRCEKCVRTMVMLAGADQLQHCATFPERGRLPGLVDALGSLGSGHVPMWLDLTELPLRADERRALDSLLARSR